MLIWAVDGGGTKTDGVLADAQGQVLARMIGEPCNLTALGVERCQANLQALLAGLCQRAGVADTDVTHAFLALGALDTEADRQEYSRMLSALFEGLGIFWQVENDVLAALYSGTWGEPGVVLLAGTGSMVMALDVHGQIKRSGGWGYLVGSDPGSAFFIGERLLIRALRDWDAGHEPDELARQALAKVGASIPPQLIDWVEGESNPARQIAQLARVVDAAAESGYRPGQEILEEAAVSMVETFQLLVPQLDFGDMAQVPVVLAGGAFRSRWYRQTVQKLLAELGRRWRPVVPEVPPVGGAYIGALRLAGRAVSAGVIQRFARELP